MAKVKDIKASEVKNINNKIKASKEPSNKGQLDKEDKTIWDKLSFVPIIIILGIVPLIVRLKIQIATGQDMSYALGANFTDVFSYWKSNVILMMAIAMVIVGFFFFRKKDMKSDKYIKTGAIAIGILALITVASAIFSSYDTLVWWGQYGQRQGAVTWISYMIIAIYSLHFYKSKEDIRYILLPLGVMATVETVILISQFVGKDIIYTEFVKSIIIPSEYGNIGDTMKNIIGGNKAYGTLYNPNYVGSFSSLLLPVFAFASIKAEKIGHRTLLIIMAIVTLVSLVASGSRAGIIGIGLSIIVAIVLLGNNLLNNPKILAIGVVGALILGLGINVVSGGAVVERIGSIGKDAMSIFGSGGSDILDNSIIKDMKIVDNKFTIDMAEGKKFNFEISSSDSVVLTDEADNNIDYVMEDVYLVPTKELPINIRFQKGKVENGDIAKDLYVVEIDTKQWFILTTEDNNLVSLDKYGYPMAIEKAEAIGFSGKEHIGSNRGYIWSRSLPILRDNLLLGVGPDAFVAVFPQGDIVMRNAVYNYATAIADKPHNLYLQIGINQGIIALGAFLVLNGAYIVNSFKVYFKKKEYSFHDMFGIGIMLGIVGYLGAGMFNDSVVSVAPLYWCLLGIGFAVNYINLGDSCGQ